MLYSCFFIEKKMTRISLCLWILPLFIHAVMGIRCYQCSSSQEPKNQDSCGAYDKFEKEKHIPVDCNSEDANTPGTFCMKMVKQGPLGFIWDGRWRHVIRRCASVAEHGNTEVCNWGVYKNGDYWEECYCSHDGCNSSNTWKPDVVSFTLQMLVIILLDKFIQMFFISS